MQQSVERYISLTNLAMCAVAFVGLLLIVVTNEVCFDADLLVYRICPLGDGLKVAALALLALLDVLLVAYYYLR